jgi:hypothetical protein
LGTPAIFNFSAGAPKDAVATAGVEALETTCADALQKGAAAKQLAATKVLHNQRKSDLFTIAWML